IPRVKAVQIVDLSGPDGALQISDVPEPEAKHMLTPDGAVVVEVHAAGVSFPEVLQTRGEYQLKPPVPFVPGSEVAGIVRSAPDGGADDVVRCDGPWKDQEKEVSGGGVDVVLDPVGGDRFTDSLRSLGEGGRVVVVGFTGGSIPEVKVNRLLLNNTEVVGAGWGAYVTSKPDVIREIGAEIARLIGDGFRSEERRVGKERRNRGARYQDKKKE